MYNFTKKIFFLCFCLMLISNVCLSQQRYERKYSKYLFWAFTTSSYNNEYKNQKNFEPNQKICFRVNIWEKGKDLKEPSKITFLLGIIIKRLMNPNDIQADEPIYKTYYSYKRTFWLWEAKPNPCGDEIYLKDEGYYTFEVYDDKDNILESTTVVIGE